MSNPPSIYWVNKANMCRAIGHKQIDSGDIEEGVRNLFRMSHALSMAQYEQAREREQANGLSSES